MCKKSKCFSIFYFVWTFSNTAVSPLISTRLCENLHSMSNFLATFVRASEYLGTPNITPGALMYSTCIGRPCFLHVSVQRYNIFCGAPAHFMGGVGSVKIAVPFFKFFPSLATFEAYCS